MHNKKYLIAYWAWFAIGIFGLLTENKHALWGAIIVLVILAAADDILKAIEKR